MKRITIYVPEKKKGVFFASTGGQKRAYENAASVIHSIQARLLRAKFEGKGTILVKYPDGSTNETLPSNDRDYLLHCVGCFLEDYLSRAVNVQRDNQMIRQAKLGIR